MNKRTLIFRYAAIALVLLAACAGYVYAQSNSKKNMKTTPQVRISTNYGDIVVRLYDETPEHRDNFLKLAREGYFDGTLFHRVIKDFMIQGGDPDSKGAPAGKQLGSGGPGYTVPAEFVYPQYFHKRGVLSAARQADQVNPERRSSGSQFYIVWGKTYTESALNQLAAQLDGQRGQQIFNGLAAQHRDSIQAMYQRGDQKGLMELQNRLRRHKDLPLLLNRLRPIQPWAEPPS